MAAADIYKMSREELIAYIEKKEKYNKALQQAIRHYAMNLLNELKKIRNEEWE
jgi:hypothetical protein